MSLRINQDWDLCWHYLSRTGCKNLNCKWRHENSGDQFYQNYNTRARGKGVNYLGDARKKPGAPFYPIKQHHDGGVEDQFGLIHYTNGCKKSITSREKLGYRQDFEQYSRSLSPMSELSACMTSTPTSSAFGSDSVCDMVKNAMLPSTRDLSKFQKRINRVFLDDLVGEFKTPRRELKMNCQAGKAISSSFSPFAKVFVPRVNSVTSKHAISAGLSERRPKNLSLLPSQQPANQKSCEIIDEKVYE